MKGGNITALFTTQFTQTQALNRLSNHLNHAFHRRTEKNEFEATLNILLQKILTSELRNNLLFKNAIKKKILLQIKIMICGNMTIRMAKIKNADNTKCWSEREATATLTNCWEECKLLTQLLWKTVRHLIT